jgi:hypothetical protein
MGSLRHATLWFAALYVGACITFMCEALRGLGGEKDHCLDAQHKHYCDDPNTPCGTWTGRQYYPSSCTFRHITPEHARLCLANRTIACVGDSIMRDMCHGIGMFLGGMAIESAPDVKFDRVAADTFRSINATRIGSFRSWKLNGEHYNGLLYPEVQGDETWQVQAWTLRNGDFLKDHHLEDVLSGVLRAEEPRLRHVDIAFWSYGLHEQRRWNMPPYGEKYYNHFVEQWLRVRQQVPVPLVWTSINEQCVEMDPQKRAPGDFKKQSEMIRQANAYTRKKLRELKLPYYDLAAPLRTPQICDISGDGLHVKVWVDLVRAQILLNHLCDENNNWVGGAEAFV